MNIHPDDPRWTAYVLGELSDADRAEVEQELESSPEAREIVDEIRMMTMLLKDELAKEPSPSLVPDQRRAVREAAVAQNGAGRRQWFAGAFAAAAVAAVLLLGVALPSLLRKPASDLGYQAASEQPTKPVNAPAPPAVVPSTVVPSAEAPVPTAQSAAAYILNKEKQTEAVKLQAEERLADASAGVVTGVVSDSSGSRIPGVEVTLISAAIPAPVVTTTDETGSYRFEGLPPGKYTVTCTLAGFVAFRQEFVVNPESLRIALAAKLEVAPVAEQATVSSSSPEVDQKAIGDFVQNAQANARQQGQGGQRPVAPRTSAENANAIGGAYGRGTAATRSFASPQPPPAAGPVPAALPPGFRPDRPRQPFNTEAYDRIEDNSFHAVAENPLATFSIDVDTASYANMRRFIDQGQLPPKDAVRIEELINYFSYDYAGPSGSRPIAVHPEVAAAPWDPTHRLVRIGVKAKDVDMRRRPPSNLVFLIDVSGSMESPDKLPLLKSGLKLLVDKLTENDRVSMVVYAGNSGLVLPPTTGDKKEFIARALDRLQAGGSTNGASGIQLAYNTAISTFIRGGINRVILCTDGDFNVGVTNQGDLTRLIEDKAKSGVFLSVLGFGTGNLKDSTMEKLADKGNGNYAYIDSINEARKVLVEQMGGTLMTVAKDVKIQVDFNPAKVNAYRLIGYENRVLANQDFNDDTRDAGDMGAGHTVTALFEIVPRGVDIAIPGVDASKYSRPSRPSQPAAALEKNDKVASNELLTVRVRYKTADGTTSTRFDVPLVDRGSAFNAASADYRFAAAVAEFGMILRDSPYKGSASLDQVIRIAEPSKGLDKNGYREEFVSLAKRARRLKGLE
jgi:Ca-activated chloride channel homolog